MSDYKYLEICEQLRTAIYNGVYATGKKLPSENQLANKTGFSRQTIRQAMAILEQEGLTDRVQGSGTFVRSQTARRPKTYNIAVVTTYINEYIFPAILQGILDVLSDHGYTPLLSATQNRVDLERNCLLELMNKPIDGILVEGTKTALPNPNLDLYEKISHQGIPVVFINGFYPGLKRPIYVVTRDRQGGMLACQRLLEKGHKHIAGFFKSDDIQGHRRYEGYAEALVKAGQKVEDSHVLWYTTETRDLLIQNCAADVLDGCTAAVCYNDQIAVRAIQACPDRSIEWVSFDNSIQSRQPGSSFFSLGNPKEKLGKMAAEKLLNLLDGKSESPTVLDWELLDDPKKSTFCP